MLRQSVEPSARPSLWALGSVVAFKKSSAAWLQPFIEEVGCRSCVSAGATMLPRPTASILARPLKENLRNPNTENQAKEHELEQARALRVSTCAGGSAV